MSTSMLHYFRFCNHAPSSKDAAPINNNTPVCGLSASWYMSQEKYELARRAVFSKRWLFITHSSRLGETGDWIRYEIAGFDFIITRDHQGHINGFHNVCRHRPY